MLVAEDNLVLRHPKPNLLRKEKMKLISLHFKGTKYSNQARCCAPDDAAKHISCAENKIIPLSNCAYEYFKILSIYQRKSGRIHEITMP